MARPLPGLDVPIADQSGRTTSIWYEYLQALNIAGSQPVAYNLTNYPPSMDACVRLASNGTAHQYGIIYAGGGNGLWLYSPTRSQFEFTRVNGSGQLVDITNCTVGGVAGQSLSAGQLYYAYAYEAATEGGDLRVDHLLPAAGPTTGDPYGASTVLGWQFANNGTFDRRLIGALKTTVAGDLWLAGTRGVYYSGIASYYQRQHLNYHTKVSGGNSATSWTEINSNQVISALLWDDGAEDFGTLSGSVQSDTAGATVSVGISINAESPPFDYVDVYCAVVNVPYPFCVTITGGDYSTDVHTYRVLMKNSAGHGVITGNRSGSPATGATFAIKLEQ